MLEFSDSKKCIEAAETTLRQKNEVIAEILLEQVQLYSTRPQVKSSQNSEPGIIPGQVLTNPCAVDATLEDIRLGLRQK